ncbi:hypothetical protein [Sagittula sp. S175]|uniref:hypothetical protein n=1 Tax=Sagittula sp. S175 TaxID=3415129 RepID=UPI003C7C72BD
MRLIRSQNTQSEQTPRLSVVGNDAYDGPQAQSPVESNGAGSVHSPVPPLRPRVEIPVRDPSPDAEECARYTARGRFLARQEAWDELAEEMQAAESQGQLTTGLYPVAGCLAQGARADAVEAACAAGARGEPRAVQAVLAAFETSLEDEDAVHRPALTYITAMAHVDMAHAWRGASATSKLSQQRRAAYAHHMKTAQAMADLFDPFETGSPLWAALRCAVLEADTQPAARLADDYEDLIELAPCVPATMKALGDAARPHRFGTWEVLDNEARRVAMQTRDIWGVGGYAWVYMGALERDLGAFRRLDAELFSEGLHDILDRFPTQDMANRLAAFTGVTVGGPCDPGSARRRVADAFGWITQDHLRELHPAIWAHAPTPGRAVNNATSDDILKRGRIRANSSLAEYYAPALEAGRRLVFTADGVRMLKE